MAFSDPQSVTIGSAISLPRTGQAFSAGDFTSADGATNLSIRHVKTAKGKRFRRTARLDYAKYVASPEVTGTNLRVNSSVQLSLDVPINGFTTAEQVQLITAVTTWLTASTNAAATKVVGGES